MYYDLCIFSMELSYLLLPIVSLSFLGLCVFSHKLLYFVHSSFFYYFFLRWMWWLSCWDVRWVSALSVHTSLVILFMLLLVGCFERKGVRSFRYITSPPHHHGIGIPLTFPSSHTLPRDATCNLCPLPPLPAVPLPLLLHPSSLVVSAPSLVTLASPFSSFTLQTLEDFRQMIKEEVKEWSRQGRSVWRGENLEK